MQKTGLLCSHSPVVLLGLVSPVQEIRASQLLMDLLASRGRARGNGGCICPTLLVLVFLAKTFDRKDIFQ